MEKKTTLSVEEHAARNHARGERKEEGVVWDQKKKATFLEEELVCLRWRPSQAEGGRMWGKH